MLSIYSYITDLWIFDSTNYDSDNNQFIDIIHSNPLLVTGDTANLLIYPDNRFSSQFDSDAILDCTSATLDSTAFTIDAICKFNDSTSEHWWMDGQWHVVAIRRDPQYTEVIIDSTSEDITDTTASGTISIMNIFMDSTDYEVSVLRISDQWLLINQLLSTEDNYVSYYNDYNFYISVSENNECRYFIPTPGHEDYEYLLQIPDHVDATTFIPVPDCVDYNIFFPTPDYLDYNIFIPFPEYVDTTTFIPVPDHVEASIFFPTPGYNDYNYRVYTSDYVDGSIYLWVLGISFREVSFINKVIVTSYTDSGGIQEGFFLNIETYFGFWQTNFKFICITDNLAESAHILVSTQEGHGNVSPIMLVEYGPYFGVSATYRVLHNNWVRYYQKYYGYSDFNDAMVAIQTHRAAGADLVDIVFDPPGAGWYIARWKDTVDGVFNYEYFNNLNTVTNFLASLVSQGKFEIDSHIWESTMPYFPVYTVTASYAQDSNIIILTNADIDDLNANSGYIWHTIVTDANYETGWENESGFQVPHWLRVIF